MALKWLRDNLKHLKFILWGVVLVFVLLVFAEWGGGGGGVGGGVSADFAVRVGSSELSQRDFLRRLKDLDSSYHQRFGDQWEQFRAHLDLTSQVANQFINAEVLAREAERMGLVVTDDELNERIRSELVTSDGTFIGRERYAGYVRRTLGMTLPEYEDQKRKELLIGKLQEMMVHGLYVSDHEVEEEHRRSSETASFSAIKVASGGFLSAVEAEDSEVEQYYTEHAEELVRDEQRVLRYLLVDTARLKRLLEVEDAEIEAYYESHGDEFMQGEKAHARHVLIGVEPGAGESARAAAQLKAESIATMARKGADFAELASRHSEDPGSKAKGGDLGWFGRGQMVKAFEDAVFNNKPGDIIGPIKSEYGYHVIKIEGFTAPSQQPLEEVREQVRRRLVEGRAAAEAEVRAGALEARLRAEKPADDAAWQAIADEDEAVTLNLSPAFAADATVIPGVGNDPELVSQVFAAAPGSTPTKRAVALGWMVWQLKQVNPEGVPPLSEVEAQVRQQVLQAKARELARAKAAELAEQWRNGAEAEALAESVDTKVGEATDHRRDGNIPEIGAAAALDRAVFAAQEGAVVGPVAVKDGVAIARVSSLQLVGPAELAEQLPAAREQLVERRAGELMSSIIGELRRQDPPLFNNEFLTHVREQLQAQSQTSG